MAKYIIDIETNLAHDKIWLAVTKNIETGEVVCHREAGSLRNLIKDKDTLIGHNVIGFDLPVLNKQWNMRTTLTQAVDTLVLSRLANPVREGGHSLSNWGKTLGSAKIDFSDYDAGWSPEMEEYCIQDVNLTHLVYKQVLKELEGFSQQSIDLEHKVQYIISKQEKHGFRFDIINGTKLANKLKARMQEIETELQAIFPPIVNERISEKTGKRLKDEVIIFNPGSRQQIADRLMSVGWKPKKFTEKGSVIVDEAVLEKVTIPQAKPIAEYLMLQKRIGQLTNWFDAVKPDGRVYGRVNTIGAITNRMAHFSPNMAQVPNSGSPYGTDCRALWTVDEGNVLVGCDASGLELRMLAHYMADDDYTNEILNGDIHTANQKAAGLAERSQAKTFIYAFLYGAGDEKIGSIVGVSPEEVEKVWERDQKNKHVVVYSNREQVYKELLIKKGKALKRKFLSNTPALKALREKVARFASKGYITGLDGRKLFIRSEHAALNTLLQGAGAIVMKQALAIMHDKFTKAKIPHGWCANVHDEVQIETKEGYGDIVGQMAVDSIKEAGIVLNLRCPLDGEYKVGKTWRDTH